MVAPPPAVCSLDGGLTTMTAVSTFSGGLAAAPVRPQFNLTAGRLLQGVGVLIIGGYFFSFFVWFWYSINVIYYIGAYL